MLGRAEQQVLGLDPAHRAGELPREQLDQQGATQAGRVGLPGGPVLEHRLEEGGVDEVGDLLDVGPVEGEQARHQVGDVAADQDRRVDRRRQQVVQALTEVVDAGVQLRGVERHVDAGHQDEGGLAVDACTPLLDGLLERLETGNRAGDGVLRATQVVVDDLDELTGVLGQLGDERGDVVVGQTGLRGTDRGEAVVAPAVRVARDQVVHGHAATEHDLEQCLEREDAGDGGERVVLADRVTAGEGVLDEDAGLTHLGDLGDREGRHGDLGELGQEQHAVGVTVQLPVGPQLGRVVPDDREDREAERVAGVLVGAVPDLAGGGGAGAGLEAHALALDALAGEGVRRTRGRHDGLGDHRQLAVGAAGHLDDGVATDDAGALDGDLHLGAGQQRGDPAGQPAADRTRVVRRADRGGGALRHGGEPHAVHDRAVEAREAGGGHVGVQRVVVATDRREGAHVVGSGHGEAVEACAGLLLARQPRAGPERPAPRRRRGHEP